MEGKKICCLCGKEFVGYGNDPWPVIYPTADEECCDECNDTRVIPKRIELIMSNK